MSLGRQQSRGGVCGSYLNTVLLTLLVLACTGPDPGSSSSLVPANTTGSESISTEGATEVDSTPVATGDVDSEPDCGFEGEPEANDAIPGIAPVIVSVEVNNGGTSCGAGGCGLVLDIAIAYTDEEGDLGWAEKQLWYAVGASSPCPEGSPYLSGGSSRGEGPLYSGSITFGLGVGNTFAYNTVYSFTALLGDEAGNWSAPGYGTGVTPMESGEDGTATW